MNEPSMTMMPVSHRLPRMSFPAMGIPTATAHLSWRARRNLARQFEELVTAGYVAECRALIRSQAMSSEIHSIITLCNDATLAILQAENALRSIARTEEEHGIVTRNAAFTQALVQQLIADQFVR
jgi:hypothetical protein